MKIISRIIAFLYLFFTSQSAHSQATIENLDLNEGLQKAKKEGKILMVIMDDSDQSDNNSLTSQALLDSDAYQINQFAIVIRPPVTSADWEKLNKKFYIAPAMGTLFFNPQELLVDRYDAISPHGEEYLLHAGIAFADLNLPSESEQLVVIVKSNFLDITSLEKLVDTRNRYNEPIDDLIDPFVLNTPIDSFDNYHYFHLLARLAPTLSSKADSIFRQSLAFDSLWYQIPPSERSKINSEIVKKTMNTAVKNKDFFLANRTARYGYNIMGNSTQRAKMKYQLSLITDFYYRTQDTVSYLYSATKYVDDYLMTLSIDSLKAFYINKENDSANMGGTVTIFAPGATPENLPYYSHFLNIEQQLNRFAWRFYKMSSDTALLLKALTWSKRSLEFNPSPHARDTYAQLLYVTGNRQEGIEEEKKALSDFQKNNEEKNVADSKLVLNRMLSGAEKIDE
jgi:hypothetical protein